MSLQWNFPFYTGKVTTQAGTLAQFKRKSSGIGCCFLKVYPLACKCANLAPVLIYTRTFFVLMLALNVVMCTSSFGGIIVLIDF